MNALAVFQKAEAEMAAALKLEIDAFDPNTYVAAEGSDLSAEEALDVINDRYETALINSWTDQQGLLTGGVAWVEANVPRGERLLFWQDIPEGVLAGESKRQISLEHHVSLDGLARFIVSYQHGLCHFVSIDQFAATISVSEDGIPYEVYRPCEVDGERQYALSRRVRLEEFVIPGNAIYLTQLVEDAQQFIVSSRYYDRFSNELADTLDVGIDSYATYELQTTHVTPEMLLWLDHLKSSVAVVDPDSVSVEEFIELIGAHFNRLTGLIDAMGEGFYPLEGGDEITQQLELIDSNYSTEEIRMY